MFSSNSSNVATPISDLSNESLIIPEEIDFLRAFVPGIKNGKAIIKCRYCPSQWASLNITHKKAHLSNGCRARQRPSYVSRSCYAIHLIYSPYRFR